MFLPIRTNVENRRTPYVNYALIAINIAVFLITYYPHTQMAGYVRTHQVLRDWALQFELNPAAPFLWQFVTYAFLHAGIGHILGNMFFLFLFGNNVNDKLGHIGYLCFYLAGGVAAGLGHSLLHSDPVPMLGASGAVAAVTGAYLVLFPQTLITVVYWFFFIGMIDVPALYFIGFKMIFWDNVFERRTHSVAYDAHLAGYIFGIGSITLLLAVGLLEKSTFDLWSMIKRWNRRRQYKSVANQGCEPFTSSGRKFVKAKQRKMSPAEEKKQEQILLIRGEISSFLSRSDLNGAADKYMQLMDLDSKQLLAKQNLLDVSNQLMAMNKWTESATAYEKFLAHYSGYEYAEQVELMLGILYSRYLDQADKALKYLEKAKGKLRDVSQKNMCENEIAKLKGIDCC